MNGRARGAVLLSDWKMIGREEMTLFCHNEQSHTSRAIASSMRGLDPPDGPASVGGALVSSTSDQAA
ncbi:hypothetical protein [Rhodopseudomonas sp. NSM]|uniref:hypothetical protein n=1 Tax=Rhodopseudomonas sp. NSM TaxID=3457630 RepID=UPI0040359081